MKELYSIEIKEIPIISIRGLSIFPQMVIHFDIGRNKSIQALEKALIDESDILLCTQIDPRIEEPKFDDFYHMGTVAKIKQILRLPGGNIRVLVEGISRGEIIQLLKDDEYFYAEIKEYVYQPDNFKMDKLVEAAMRLLIMDLEEYISLNPKGAERIMMAVADIGDPERLCDVIASFIILKQEDNQKLLSEIDIIIRMEMLHAIIQTELELLRLEEKINQRVKQQINKLQKEYFLKEQLKAIHKELGDEDEILSEAEELREKIEAINMPKEIKEKALKEVERLIKAAFNSAEVGIIRTYIDWIIELPWDRESISNFDLKKATEILDKDHYGLEEVKTRIIEFLAVRKLKDSSKGPIICLVGPPGVGKTSIAKSVARALNREFVNMSLGGVRDEAEIRGHRRTYVGSMPGRIISLIKKAGTKNPVFLFDEIDKVNSDFKGDPASALLEVLDGEQNNNFVDHYLDFPFDLSKVLFLTTANTLYTIPPALRDRMEIIEINSYTAEEKFQIAKQYLIPKQMDENGLIKKQFKVTDSAVKSVIENYTKEAGVRKLERKIGTLCRKAVLKIIGEETNQVNINIGNLEKFLGPKDYISDTIEQKNQIGIANGLAWTEVGGVTLTIEVATMPGKGNVQLTGKLGDVMKESAHAAISYIRSNATKYGIEENFNEKIDIHIHVPEGAVPKDGPSAGITITTAILSALTKKPVLYNIAMTGEMTLRGRVLAIGGLKEKALAAVRMGIKKIIVPKENKKDIVKISEEIRETIDFVFVENFNEVIKEVFEKGAFDGN